HLDPALLEAMSAADRVIVLSALRQWQRTKEERDAFDAEVTERLARIPEARVLLTLTGVGPITAAVGCIGRCTTLSEPQAGGALCGARPIRTPVRRNVLSWSHQQERQRPATDVSGRSRQHVGPL